MKNNSLSLFFGFLVFVSLWITKDGGTEETKKLSAVLVKEDSLIAAAPILKSSLNSYRLNFAENYAEAAFRSPAPVDLTTLIINETDAAPPVLNVAEAAVFDLDGDFVFFHYDGNRRWPIASITKLLTTAVAAEKIGVQKIITINEKAVAAEGGVGGFAVGEKYTVEDLVKAMLVVSSNDAAVALAENYGYDNFIKDIQSKIIELEMTETVVVDPTGLSIFNQSTPADLKKLITYFTKRHGAFLEVTRRPETVILELSSQTEKKLKNINLFAGRGNFLGGKTGYLDEAGGNLLSVFSAGGRRLLIVVFGAKDRFAETEALLNWVLKSYNF